MKRLSRSRRRRRPKYVIDTSTLCRGIRTFFSRDRGGPAPETNPAAALFVAWQENDSPAFDWIYSEDILAEYKEVLNEMELRDLYIGQLIGAIRRKGIRVTPASLPNVSPDPADDMFYGAAETASDVDIVTTNPKHFPQTDKVRVISPEEALARLSSASRP